jgi:hypothetical protein
VLSWAKRLSASGVSESRGPIGDASASLLLPHEARHDWPEALQRDDALVFSFTGRRALKNSAKLHRLRWMVAESTDEFLDTADDYFEELATVLSSGRIYR